MTKEEIIKPENLVYKKPTLMNDNAMHYCPVAVTAWYTSSLPKSLRKWAWKKKRWESLR